MKLTKQTQAIMDAIKQELRIEFRGYRQYIKERDFEMEMHKYNRIQAKLELYNTVLDTIHGKNKYNLNLNIESRIVQNIAH